MKKILVAFYEATSGYSRLSGTLVRVSKLHMHLNHITFNLETSADPETEGILKEHIELDEDEGTVSKIIKFVLEHHLID